MFFAAVGVFMVVCPLASVGIDLASGGDESTMSVVGTWFVFWAVGVRLFTAGARLAGGLFLTAVLHAMKKHRDVEENVAMVSDLAIGVPMLVHVVSQW